MIEVKVTPKGEGHNVMVAVNGNFKELVTEAFLAIGTICTGIRECGPWRALSSMTCSKRLFWIRPPPSGTSIAPTRQKSPSTRPSTRNEQMGRAGPPRYRGL